MNLNRRDFLKLSGLSGIGLFLGGILSGCRSVNKLKGTIKHYSICPFCSMGCGVVVSTKQGKIINIDGDPEHPISRGKLCAKGNSLFQLTVNSKRLSAAKYRAPGASDWQDISWEDAVRKISERIKDTRDRTFIEYEGKNTVNRADGIAFFSGSYLNNEEYYLFSKMARLLGIAYLGNDSDCSHSVTDTALTGTFGYAASTNHWIDLQHSDVILMIGSNPAENNPVSAGIIMKAKKRGCRVIHADPRFTRSTSISDLYVPLRPGSDIAFIGGMINYALQNNRINREYLIEYTNAAYLINPGYKFQNGYFNDFKGGQYNKESWDYEKDKKGIPRMDKTLKNSSCVFQIIKNHFSRYNPDVVSRITGCPVELFLKVTEIITETYKSEKAASIIYSSGATQHSVGVQNIRSYAILQLLLGNIGISGGGLNAIRPGANGQGAADHCVQTGFLPGYIPAPAPELHTSLDSYIKNITPFTNDTQSINILGRRNVHVINLLKAYYGDSAVKENDYCFHWLPKADKAFHQRSIFDEIQKGTIKGAFFAGTNPLMSLPDIAQKIKAMENLEWMVVSDIFETETAVFWKKNSAIEKIKTEVFLLPSASSMEKDGSMTNSGRWAQWKNKVIDPPGQAKSDLWILDKIYKTIKKLYAEDRNAAFPDSIINSGWDYDDLSGGIDPKRVAHEINGYKFKDRMPVNSISQLKDDGSTAAGNWLYCGSFTEKINMMERRNDKDPGKAGLFSKWAWSWPGNSRILYNRACVKRNGTPWNPDRWVTRWEDEWEGDNVNGDADSGPAERNPFAMLYEGVARIFAKDFIDGPLPEHYEPVESPMGNLLNPLSSSPVSAAGSSSMINNPGFPHIATIYNIAEQLQYGIIGRNISWINELSPYMFCEISRSLAESKGVRNGDKVQINSRKGKISVYCLVSERIRPFIINGRSVEMIGIVMNSNADLSNNPGQLLHSVGDPYTGVPEYKAFLVNIAKEA